MDLKGFITALFALYPNSWNDTNKILKQRQYTTGLDNPKVDFELLLDRIAKYHNDDFMPTCAWLRDQSKFCYTVEFKNKSRGDWLHVKVLDPRTKTVRNLECFPKDTTQAQILNFYENTFDCTGWEILEVYS